MVAERTAIRLFASGPDPEEPYIDMAEYDKIFYLRRAEVPDGDTEHVSIGGRTCRQTVDPEQDHYIYFRVVDDWAFDGNRPVVDISVMYYDQGTSALRLHYDSTDTSAPNDKYKRAEEVPREPRTAFDHILEDDDD